MVVRLLFSLLMCVQAVFGADLHTEGAAAATYGLAEKWEGILYARGRVVAKDNQWYDVSVMPAVSFQAHPVIEISGGAFFTRFDPAEEFRTNIVRPFIAVEPELKRSKFSFGARSRVERFLITAGESDFSRFRERFQITRNGNWAPYAFFEVYFTAEGFTKTRYSAGIEKRVATRHTIDFAYFYESSRFVDGGLRHMIRTTFRFEFRGRWTED